MGASIFSLRLARGWLWLAACCCVQLAAADELVYKASFHGRFVPVSGCVSAAVHIDQQGGEVRLLDLAAPPDRFFDFAGDGRIERLDDRLLWWVPPAGGRLTYRVVVDHRRGEAFDARMTERWALLRLGDVFPPARARALKGAVSNSSLTLAGPAGWSIETRYGPADGPLSVADPDRRFDRPTGWAVAGRIGVRRERIAGRRVAVAAPVDEGFRRLDVLTFLRWTLPFLVDVFPSMPERLLVVGAADEMWRGGLSGPGSLYIHSARPLVSENATSTLLHELVHVAAAPGKTADDWVVEGLAEYYGLEALRRSGGISRGRFQQALQWLQTWADEQGGVLADPSRGPDTARAVLIFHAVAGELDAVGGSLDTVTRELVAARSLNRVALTAAVERLLGRPSRALAD